MLTALRLVRAAGFDPPSRARRQHQRRHLAPRDLEHHGAPGRRALRLLLAVHARGKRSQRRHVAAPGQNPILTWKTRILSLRDFAADEPLGYGGTYVTKAPAHVAVLPVGYADGYNRQLSNRGRVIVREHYAPIVGSISMDLTLVDVTGIPGVAVGDEVILLGTGEGLSVDALEHARLASSSPYEILCNISSACRADMETDSF